MVISLELDDYLSLRLDGSFTDRDVFLDKCQTFNEGKTIHGDFFERLSAKKLGRGFCNELLLVLAFGCKSPYLTNLERNRWFQLVNRDQGRLP